MRIAVLGWRSSLAQYILKVAPPAWEVWKTNLDVTNTTALYRSKAKPDVVINCASVLDKRQVMDMGYNRLARRQPYAPRREQTDIFRVNAKGAGNAALWAKANNAYLIHVSCDEVMGTEGPYWDNQRPYPQSDYAYSKYVGELAVKALGGEYTIMRFGWLYGSAYVNSYPVVAASRREPRISDDERGQPIHANTAARMIMRAISMWEGKAPPKLIHVSTNKTPVSWYEFLEPYYPNIQADYRRGKKMIYIKYGLHSSGEEWQASDPGMALFQYEVEESPVWRDAKKQ